MGVQWRTLSLVATVFGLLSQIGRNAALATPSAVAPAWLELRPGTLARVDIAPWAQAGRPEAALTGVAASLRVDFSADASRPATVLPEPVGVRVRVVRVLPHAIVLVHGLGARWEGYAPADRLVPEVPAGTRLTAAGNFDGFADFYPSLGTPQTAARELPTASGLVALRMGVATYDPQSSDLVRVRVRVTSGPAAGQTGWIAVAYTGLPTWHRVRASSAEEGACSCRPLAFDP